MSEEFQYIDPNPLASASVAQVHRAKLRSGEEVVLKVCCLSFVRRGSGGGGIQVKQSTHLMI